MNEQSKWSAVINCDERYDGRFYYAVRTTGIFCRPSCKSRPPAKENIRYFNTPEQALKENYRPCKRCRPDLLIFEPTAELAERAKAVIQEHFAQQNELKNALKYLGVTSGHLSVIFKDHFGLTPHEYTDSLRMHRAKELLKCGRKTSILFIAESCGYESLSAFYTAFKQDTGLTPGMYRKKSNSVLAQV